MSSWTWRYLTYKILGKEKFCKLKIKKIQVFEYQNSRNARIALKPIPQKKSVPVYELKFLNISVRIPEILDRVAGFQFG